MKKFYMLIGLQIALGLNAAAQQSTSSCSHHCSLAGGQFEYSIGEMTLVSTERNSHMIVTQGYLQPFQSPSLPFDNNRNTETEPGLKQLLDHFAVYPNPTENLLFIEFNGQHASEINYQLYDAGSRMIINKTFLTAEGHNKLTIDMRSLLTGSYFLILNRKDESGKSNNYSYKVQKVN